MKRVIQGWNDISIRKKIILMMGSIIVATWVLICAVVLQQQKFSQESSVIMNDYMEITRFLDAFSAENVCLEVYMRGNAPDSAEEDYLLATAETNLCLKRLRPADGSPAGICAQARHQQRHVLLSLFSATVDEHPGRGGQHPPVSFHEDPGGIH